MRIGIDARFYGPRVGGGGIGRYVAELITHLQEIDRENEYILFLKKENFHDCVITNPRFYKELVDVHWYGLAEQRAMPRAIRRARVDFMHFPHWNIPYFSRTPFLVTIHDLILLEHSDSARTSTRSALVHGFKYAAFRTLLEKAVYKSRQIITVSQHSKRSIERFFDVDEKKISVIPNGVTPPVPKQQISLAKHGIFEPFFLYVGNAYPHKNLSFLVQTFAMAAAQYPYIQLVIAGKRDAFSLALEREAVTLGLSADRIKFVDTPSDDMLAHLYKEARLFIYPSICEGFGIPPLEALAHGTPVAASSIDPMPEILQDGAYYFDPHDHESLLAIMRIALERPAALAQKTAQANNILQLYNWHHVAERTLDVYRHVAKSLS